MKKKQIYFAKNRQISHFTNFQWLKFKETCNTVKQPIHLSFIQNWLHVIWHVLPNGFYSSFYLHMSCSTASRHLERVSHKNEDAIDWKLCVYQWMSVCVCVYLLVEWQTLCTHKWTINKCVCVILLNGRCFFVSRREFISQPVYNTAFLTIDWLVWFTIFIDQSCGCVFSWIQFKWAKSKFIEKKTPFFDWKFTWILGRLANQS